MALIKLTRGCEAIIDDTDLPLVSGRKWSVALRDKDKHIAYAIASKGVLMHRLITGAGRGQVVDHINGNGLDNRRCNLRVCTQSQNAMNQRKQERATSSKYKGVRLNSGGKWEVRVKKNGIRFALGCYENETDAAIAYNEGAKKYHGEFARLNEIHF